MLVRDVANYLQHKWEYRLFAKKCSYTTQLPLHPTSRGLSAGSRKFLVLLWIPRTSRGTSGVERVARCVILRLFLLWICNQILHHEINFPTRVKLSKQDVNQQTRSQHL